MRLFLVITVNYCSHLEAKHAHSPNWMWLSVVPGYLQTSMEGNMRDKFGNHHLQLWFWWENLKARITSGEFCWSFSTICPSDYNPCPLELPEAEEQDFKDNTAHRIYGDPGCFLQETASPFIPHENDQLPHKHNPKFHSSVSCSSKLCLLLWWT